MRAMRTLVRLHACTLRAIACAPRSVALWVRSSIDDDGVDQSSVRLRSRLWDGKPAHECSARSSSRCARTRGARDSMTPAGQQRGLLFDQGVDDGRLDHRGLRKPTSYQPQSSIMAKIRLGSGAFLVGVEKAVAAASMVASMVQLVSGGDQAAVAHFLAFRTGAGAVVAHFLIRGRPQTEGQIRRGWICVNHET